MCLILKVGDLIKEGDAVITGIMGTLVFTKKDLELCGDIVPENYPIIVRKIN